MRLAAIQISNFKALRDADVPLSSFSCLVGENNAGKSSFLQALVIALNRPQQLDSNLFYDQAAPIELRLTVDQITAGDLARLSPEHRERIADIVQDETLTLVCRYRRGERLELRVLKSQPTEPRYREDAIAGALQGQRGKAHILAALQAHCPELVDDDAEVGTIGEAKEYLSRKIKALPAASRAPTEAPLPSGISASIAAFLPEPIYIPAVKNLADDLKTTQTTSFGRLLGLLLDDLGPDLAQVTASLAQLDAFLNRQLVNGGLQDARHRKVVELEGQIQRFLQQNFPRASVELVVPPPELRTILNSAQIYVDDGSRDLIDSKGDGIKRSLTFSILRTYVHQLESKVRESAEPAAAALRPLVFLFEEPELYLHPKSQQVLFRTLAEISQTHPVIVTTHSPLFFAPGVTATFVRVAKKDEAPKPISELHWVSFALDAARSSTFQLARFEHADAGFFSRRVVLFEGESDDAYFKHISRLLEATWDFDLENIALVRVSGKGNFAKFRAFFSAFGIEVKIVADLDALFEGYQHLGAPPEADTLRNLILPVLDQRIQELALRAEPSARQVRGTVQQQSWKHKYEQAKQVVREVQAAGSISDAQVATLDSLFTWEENIGRCRVCREDAQAAQAIVPLLDRLRDAGICVLSKGAIEDYYAANTPGGGSKPERALAAIELVRDGRAASALSTPLTEGRRPELVEVVAELFR